MLKHVHVAPPLKDRLGGKKASRRKARELSMVNRLAASQAEVVYQRAEVGRLVRRNFEVSQRLLDAEEKLRDLAEVLPGRFIAVAAPLEVHNQIFRHESTIRLTPSFRPMPRVPHAPALTNEASFFEVVDAVRVDVEVHHELMARMMHAWVRTAVPGQGEAEAAYCISVEALAQTDPGVLARTITREVRPLLKQKLTALQLKLVRGSRWR